MGKLTQEKIRQEQPNLNYRERINSSLEMYSKSLAYSRVLIRGLSQTSMVLLTNYGQPGSLASSFSQHNGLLKLPASPVEPSEGKLNEGTALNSPEDALSSVKRLMDYYFSKNAPSILRAMLELMCLAYSSNFDLRKHIRNIYAKYHFSFGDTDTQISMEIKNGEMRVFPGNIELPNVSLKFKDSNALGKLFFSVKPDILDMILKQDVVMDGNLVYAFKFTYLIRHLQIKIMGPA